MHACRNCVSLIPGYNYFLTSIPVQNTVRNKCVHLLPFKNSKTPPNHLGNLVQFEETKIIVNHISKHFMTTSPTTKKENFAMGKKHGKAT